MEVERQAGIHAGRVEGLDEHAADARLEPDRADLADRPRVDGAWVGQGGDVAARPDVAVEDDRVLPGKDEPRRDDVPAAHELARGVDDREAALGDRGAREPTGDRRGGGGGPGLDAAVLRLAGADDRAGSQGHDAGRLA